VQFSGEKCSISNATFRIVRRRIFQSLSFKDSAGLGISLSAREAENVEESIKMKKFESKLFSIIAFFLSTTAAAFGASKFADDWLIVGKINRQQHHRYSLRGNISTMRVRHG